MSNKSGVWEFLLLKYTAIMRFNLLY